MKNFCQYSIISTKEGIYARRFRSSRGRGFRWLLASLIIHLVFVPTVCFLILGENITMGNIAGIFVSLAYIASMFSMARYGVVVHGKEQASVVNAGLVAPDETNLILYIEALGNEHEDVRNQTSQVLSLLLGKLSKETLSSISNFYWRVLCPIPGDTIRWSRAVNREDALNLAVIAAVMKTERVPSLPYVEGLMTCIDRRPHSDHYTDTLKQCYQLLIANRDRCEQSGTLLRLSAAPSSSDSLLRPVLTANRSETETGEQLLRSSTGDDPNVSDRK